jgi:hypothetical protein
LTEEGEISILAGVNTVVWLGHGLAVRNAHYDDEHDDYDDEVRAISLRGRDR